MRKRKTDEQFKKEVFGLVGDEYVFLEPYQGALNKIKVKHNVCGNVYEIRPSNFINGQRCPYCAGHIRKTDTRFKHEVYTLVGDEYTFLDKYVNSRTKLRVRHNKCGNVYEVYPTHFLSGHHCPYCSTKDKTKTDIQFQQEVHTLIGDEYTFLDKYVNAYTKIRVKHNKCNFVYSVSPHKFLTGKRCPNCFKTPKKNDGQFKREVHTLVGDEYVFLDKYVNNATKLKVKHNKCGNVYKVTPANFISGHRCPFCNSTPKGETIITKLLDTLNINYEYQKTFDDLIDKSYLSYDFYIPGQSILIEYQGLQHYEPIDYFGGEATFKKQQKHDKMKLGYAKEHGYNLITVPYTEDTLSKIKKYLIKHGLMS